MLLLLKFLAPVLIGGSVAGVSMFGLVQSQTGTPSDNPANQQIITYGN
jgi:hypothetical protein